MSSKQIQGLMIGFYIFLFFLYLFAPLIMMGMATTPPSWARMKISAPSCVPPASEIMLGNSICIAADIHLFFVFNLTIIYKTTILQMF